jgi:sugar phosphate isomerase/epimerase
MMRFSCADFTFPLLPHAGALRLIKMMGIAAVDVGLFAGRSHLRPEEVARHPAGAGKKLARLLHEIGLELADVFVQTGPEPKVLAANHPEPNIRREVREIFRRAVEFAEAAGARHLTGLPGVNQPGLNETEARRLAAEEANWRRETATAVGISYAVEPHLGSICPSPEATLEFLGQCPELTLTLDYGHFIYQGMSNESVHPLLSRASHFHARAGCPGRLQAPLSRNAIDFPAILTGLGRLGYAGHVCLEYVWIDWERCNEVDNVSETILLKDHLARFRSE